MAAETHHVSVFTAPDSPRKGGNPCPVVLDASGLDDEQMRAVARSHGHESAFLLPGSNEGDSDSDKADYDGDGAGARAGVAGYDFELRFFVPGHEMEMCGHATAGTTWVLNERGLLRGKEEVRYLTKSGVVRARIVRDGEEGRDGNPVLAEVSQPRGRVETVTDRSLVDEVLSVLGVEAGDALAPGVPVQNARTSRVKTVVPMRSVAVLDGLRPDFGRVEGLCERLGSTGLYPYAAEEAGDEGAATGSLDGRGTKETRVAARQFPKSSGYSEDAATGIAAAALSWALLENGALGPGPRGPGGPGGPRGDRDEVQGGREVVVRQGVAMGCPSEIRVRIEDELEEGCWVGGRVRWIDGGST